MRGAMLIWCCGLSVVWADGVEVSFAPLAEDAGRVVAATVVLDDERFATIAVVGADPKGARLGVGDGGSKLELLLHDPVSRLTILRRPGGVGGGSGVKRGRSSGLVAGDAVYLGAGGSGDASRVVKWENTHREKVLPLALMRVHHPGEEAPRPGTPLFSPAGELVAICHEPAPEFGNGTYALPVEVISRAEKEKSPNGTVVRCWIGITMEARNALPAVEAVRPESPAAEAGLRKGDILLSVGACKVGSYADAVNAFYYLLPGEPTPVRALRGTKLLKLAVRPEVHPAADLPERSGGD